MYLLVSRQSWHPRVLHACAPTGAYSGNLYGFAESPCKAEQGHVNCAGISVHGVQDSYTYFCFQVYGGGVAVAMLACVPDWPWFNRSPQKWQIPASAGLRSPQRQPSMKQVKAS